MINKIERIELERANLRANHNKNKRDLQELSYLALLSLKTNTTPKININKLSTVNLLIFLEESFNNSDKHVLNNLDNIKIGVVERPDLFLSSLKYLQNKKIRDEMFYWAPGYRVSNIFSFIVEIIPDFIEQYKNYFVKNTVCKREHYNVIHFIKERYKAEYEQFNLINQDILMFKNCISSCTWNNEKSTKKVSQKTIDYLKIKRSYEICEDLTAVIAPSTSFIEFKVFDKLFLCSLAYFDGLMSKDNKVKEWWIQNGLTVEEWEQI